MTDSVGTTRAETSAARDGGGPSVNAYETRPGRTVFTESDNTDGWISTDVTVAVHR